MGRTELSVGLATGGWRGLLLGSMTLDDLIRTKPDLPFQLF